MWTRRLGIVALLAVGFTAGESAARTPVHLWSQRLGSASGEAGYSVAVDGSGNVLVTGAFAGTVNLGGGNLVSAGSSDIFLAKYDAAGVHQWSRRFGSTFDDEGLSVAVDGSGNVLVTGYFQGTVDFGGGNLVGPDEDIFLAKFDPAGVHVWSKRLGGDPDFAGDYLAVDGSGNVLVTGAFAGTVDLGGGNLVSAGSSDIFLAKYDPAGVHLWSKRFGGGSQDFGKGVAVDGSGNVWITGNFFNTADFGGSNLMSAGLSDIFVAKYNASGAHQWSRRFGSTSSDSGFSLAVDGSGNVWVTGTFRDTVAFGGANLVSAGALDLFLAKYDAAGVHLWSKRFGHTNNDYGYSVRVDGAGNGLLTGVFFGTVDFGGGSFVSAGLFDVFVAKYGPAGAHKWSQRFGSTASDIGYALAVDSSGDVQVTGYFQGTVDFGGGNLVSVGSSDIFLAKFDGLALEPVIASIGDVGNDQGRSVAVRFDRSWHDDSQSTTPVEQYEAFLRDDALPSSVAPFPSTKAISDLSLLTPGWIFVGSVPAHRESEYLMIAPTLADSTIADGLHHSAFFIRAATSDPGIYYDSRPDSGYSRDNLAPGAPTGLAYHADNLTWNESVAPDFDHFTVYGSNTNSFASATLIDYTEGPIMDVGASPYSYYFVTATDFSGNEGNAALVHLATSDAEGPPTRYVLSVSAHPNPFNPATTIRYTLPASGRVRIAMHDARGTRVATLLEADQPAGAYKVPWNGTTDTGEVATSGVYFARLELDGEARSYKTILLK